MSKKKCENKNFGVTVHVCPCPVWVANKTVANTRKFQWFYWRRSQTKNENGMFFQIAKPANNNDYKTNSEVRKVN